MSTPHEPRGFIRRYIFATDHKIIGIQFLFTSLFMMFFGGLLALPLAALVGGYVAASMGASFFVARRSGWRHLVRLPLAYVCMHLAYGVGFLVGLVRRAFGQPVATAQETETP